MKDIDSTKTGYTTSTGVETFQDGTFPGKIVITTSRTSGFSPCGVVFSTRTTTRRGYSSHQVFGSEDNTDEVGYYFDFNDPGTGNYNTFYNTSKNTSVGGPMAIHTFEVADGGGSKDFLVAVRAKDGQGNEGRAYLKITVQAQDDYFSAANTIAVSNTLSTSLDWSAQGYDRSPPSGYTEVTTIDAVDGGANATFWDDIQGKRIMLFRGDDFTGEDIRHIRSGNDNFCITWFGDEESGTVITDTTISFAAPTEANKNAGIGGTISDTNSGLGSLTVGAEITITGTSNNNFTFVVRSVAAGSVTVRYLGKTITLENAGGSVTITEHNKYPEVKEFRVGNLTADDSNIVMTDSALSGNATAFGNDGWCENGAIDGIRTGMIELGISQKNMTFHKIDADYEDEPAGSNDFGRFKFGLGNYCWTSSNLDADSTPFPHGIVISESRFLGSTAEIAATDNPTTNISAVNSSFPTWSGIVGSVCRTASEMNFRIAGYQDWIQHDCDYLGQHIGGSGGKSRIAHRGAGMNKIGDIDEDTRRGDFCSDSTDTQLYPASLYTVAQYIYDSAGSEGDGTFSQIANATTTELHEDAVWIHWTMDTSASEYPTSVQLEIKNVRYCRVSNVTGLTNTGILDNNDEEDLESVNNGPNNVVTSGTKSTQADYLGPTLLATTASPNLYPLPVPTAPR